MVEPTTLAYIAGMIDGDGYVTITRSARTYNRYNSTVDAWVRWFDSNSLAECNGSPVCPSTR